MEPVEKCLRDAKMDKSSVSCHCLLPFKMPKAASSHALVIVAMNMGRRA